MFMLLVFFFSPLQWVLKCSVHKSSAQQPQRIHVGVGLEPLVTEVLAQSGSSGRNIESAQRRGAEFPNLDKKALGPAVHNGDTPWFEQIRFSRLPSSYTCYSHARLIPVTFKPRIALISEHWPVGTFSVISTSNIIKGGTHPAAQSKEKWTTEIFRAFET